MSDTVKIVAPAQTVRGKAEQQGSDEESGENAATKLAIPLFPKRPGVVRRENAAAHQARRGYSR